MATTERVAFGFDFFQSGFEIFAFNPSIKLEPIFAPDFAMRCGRSSQGSADGRAVKFAITEQPMRKAKVPRSSRNLLWFITKQVAVEHWNDRIFSEAFGAPAQCRADGIRYQTDRERLRMTAI